MTETYAYGTIKDLVSEKKRLNVAIWYIDIKED